MDFSLNKEQTLLRQTIREFVRSEIEPFAAETDNDGVLHKGIVEKLVDLNLPGMILPQEFGGACSNLLDCVLAIEQIGYTGCGSWWYIAFSNSIPECILSYGTKDQKNKYLSQVCCGKSFPSIQFTEDVTGSDPSMLQTRVHIEGSSYHVNGSKRFSTFGRRPGFAIVYARDAENRCTAFIVDKFCKGYSTGELHRLMGSGGIEAVDVFLDDIVLGKENVLGEPGSGFDILLYWIAIEKIQQCAACLGIAKAAMDEALDFAKKRIVRGKPLIGQQWVQFMLADMHAKLQAARMMTYRSALLKDTNQAGWKTEAATAKIFVIPTVMEIVELSRRIHGAYGYAKDYKIERLYRAVAGASAIAVSLEINQAIVARSLT
jgi:alkylation response protein AidB-like acyl-CoA dehydrogenase